MEPLTRETPKPLMPFHGKPMLQHTLERLNDWGVEEVLINCHHRADRIAEWLIGFDERPLRINISHEPEILGTGGALSHAKWWMNEDPFWMINADVIADLDDPTPLIKAYQKRSRPISALWMHAERGPRTVRMDKGLITDFHVDEPGQIGTYTFCGLQLLDRRILAYLPPQGFSSIIRGYLNAMNDGHTCAGIHIPGAYWADVGTPDQYLDAHAECATHTPFVSISPEATVSPSAKVRDSVIWPGATVRGTARIHRAIIGPGATVYGEAEGINVRAVTMLTDHERTKLKKLKWPVERTTIQPLPARGSDRSYFRLQSTGKRRAILVRYGTERTENKSYVAHTQFLKSKGVRVPGIIYDDPGKRITLMEDLGNDHLLDLVKKQQPNATRQVYLKAMEEVVRFHACGKTVGKLPLQPPFTPDLYCWERNLFEQEFLIETCRLKSRRIQPALRELASVSELLSACKPVLVHRDLQSTNIMLIRNQPVLIDYQGMRMGPAAYDLASFIADPYVMLPPELQQELLDTYVALSGDKEAARLFWPACLQRLAQALGAYGRLGRVPATERFLQFIPPALKMMIRATDNLEGFGHLHDLLVDISTDVWPTKQTERF